MLWPMVKKATCVSHLPGQDCGEVGDLGESCSYQGCREGSQLLGVCSAGKGTHLEDHTV